MTEKNQIPPELEEYVKEARRLREYFQLRRDKKKSQRKREKLVGDEKQSRFTEEGGWKR